MQESTDIIEAPAQQGGIMLQLMRNDDHDHKCSSAALLFATARPSCSKFRSVRVCVRRLICWSQKREEAGEGKQAQLLADAGILQQLWRVERSELRRRTSICAPEQMMLARRECTYGAIGVIVGRFVPHITVRTGKAPPSVDSTDRMSRCMRERA